MADLSYATVTRGRPILFKTPMVRAILDRGKSQTRRLLKPEPEFRAEVRDATGITGPGWWWTRKDGTGIHSQERLTDLVRMLDQWPRYCPLGRPGDSLWVREAWQWLPGDGDGPGRFVYRADGERPDVPRWRPSIFMPSHACRIRLRIEAVRCQPLQALTEADALAEGIYRDPPDGDCTWDGRSFYSSPIDAYFDLWDRINPDQKWTSDPIVWAITFAREVAAHG